MKRIDHIAIAVETLEEGLRFWSEALGLSVGELETLEHEGVKIAMLPVGDTRIELMEPLTSDSPVARFMAKRGPGLHHITFEVDDLVGAIESVRTVGVHTVGDAPRPGTGNSQVAFLHPKDAGGVLIELVEKPSCSPRAGDLKPGDPVLLYLREPNEKIWGVLRRLDGSGVLIEGVDLASFDEWIAQIERGDEDVVGPSILFLPMARVERMLLDRSSGGIESLTERVERRVGRSLLELLG